MRRSSARHVRRLGYRARPVAVVALVTILVAGACSSAPEPTASPDLVPTPTAAVAATGLPTDAPTPASTSRPSATPELTPTAPPLPTPTAGPIATPTPEPTAAPTPIPLPTPTAGPTSTPVASPAERPTPRLTFAPVYPDEVGGYAIDPATGLPVVPEAEGGPWWWDGEPTLELDPTLRFTSPDPASTAVFPNQGRVSLLAQFGSHEEALAVATALADALGDPAAEAAWLESYELPGGLGFDWLGSEAATTPFVDVVDRWLVVSELTYRPELDPGDVLEIVPRYASPLSLALTGMSEQLIVEETSSPDKYVAFDLVCSGDEAQLLTLQQDLADNAEIYDMQPVWLQPGITDDQRRARRTLRLLDTLAAQVLATLPGDIRFQELAQALRVAGESGSTATREAFEELRSYIEGWVLTARPDLEPLAEFLDQDVVASSAAEFSRRAALQVQVGQQTRPPNLASGQFAAAPFGAASAPVPWIGGDARTYAGLADGELTLSLGLFNGVAAGFGPLVDYLAANGCDEMRASFIDYGLGVGLREEEPTE